jgi:hypothetical protein
MTYNQYYNILSFTYLFLTTNSQYHSPDYYLEKAEIFLGDIEIDNVTLNKEYINQWKNDDKRVHSILNYLKSIQYNVCGKNIIEFYTKEIGNIDKIPDIQMKGLHPLLYEMLDEHLKDEDELILKLKRKTILRKVL